MLTRNAAKLIENVDFSLYYFYAPYDLLSDMTVPLMDIRIYIKSVSA